MVKANQKCCGPIPVLKPSLPSAEELIPYLKRIDNNRQYSNFGPLVKIFEQRICNFHKKMFKEQVFAASVSNGTAALTLSLLAMDLPQNSLIAIPALTFVATANAVLNAGHIPVVLDVDPCNWMLTPQYFDNVMKHKIELQGIKAVVPVCTFGMRQDLKGWKDVMSLHGVKVVIDAAGAIGGQESALGIPIVVSLHATKALTCGEGGLVLSGDQSFIEKIKALSNFGFGFDDLQGGTNAKLSEYAAAVGNADLDRFENTAQVRRKLFSNYVTALTDIGFTPNSFQQGFKVFAPALFNILLEDGERRLSVERAMQNQNIMTRRWYLPLIHNIQHLKRIKTPVSLTNAEELEQRIIGLPFYSDLSDADLNRVVATLA